MILCLAVLVELRLVTDGRADGRTDGQTDTGPCIASRGKKLTNTSKMAEGLQLVLCSFVCFLIKNYCQTQVKVLKSAL